MWYEHVFTAVGSVGAARVLQVALAHKRAEKKQDTDADAQLREELRKDLLEAKRDIEQLRLENSKLRVENAVLLGQNRELIARSETFISQLRAASIQIEQLMEREDKLHQHNSELHKQRQEAIAALDKLRAETGVGTAGGTGRFNKLP